MLRQNAHDNSTHEQRAPRSQLISTSALIILHTVFNSIASAPEGLQSPLSLTVLTTSFQETSFKHIGSNDASVQNRWPADKMTAFLLEGGGGGGSGFKMENPVMKKRITEAH